MRKRDVQNLLVRVFGWRATLFYGDPTLFDRWRWVRKRLAEGPVRTLDAGSGSGTMTIYATTLGNDVVGVSYDSELNEAARERARIAGLGELRLLEADLRELEGGEHGFGEFDQVLCLEVIEHVLDDRGLVRDLAARLAPGGRLLLTTPTAEHRRLVGEHVTGIEDGGHVRYGYERGQLEEIITAAGLELAEVGYVSGFMSQQVTNAMRALKRLNYNVAWAITMPLRILQVLDRPLTRLTRWPYLSIAAVAVKPR